MVTRRYTSAGRQNAGPAGSISSSCHALHGPMVFAERSREEGAIVPSRSVCCDRPLVLRLHTHLETGTLSVRFVVCPRRLDMAYLSAAHARRWPAADAEIAGLAGLARCLGTGPLESISPSAPADPCAPIEDCLLQLPFAAGSVFPPSAPCSQQQVCRSPPRTRVLALVVLSNVLQALADASSVALPPPFLLHDAAAQIASHLQPSRAPPPSSVP